MAGKPPRDSKPPDVEAATADRVCAHRDEHIADAGAVLAKLAVYVPRVLLEDALRTIAKSANRLAWACEREGEHHAGLRKTVRRTPPDPDRAPRRRADWDDDVTPVITAQERARRGR